MEERTIEKRQDVITKLTKPFPKSAIKQRVGAFGKKLDYIDGTTAVNRLNDATYQEWSCDVTDFQVIPWGKTKTGDDQILAYAVVRLEIPILNSSRVGLGVQIASYKSEDLLKGAISDGIKNAASKFGVAGELYGENIEVPDSPIVLKKRLGQLLASQGFKKIDQANEAAKVRWNKPTDDLSMQEIETWVKELELAEKPPIANF